MPRKVLVLILVIAAMASFLVFVLSFAGHPPFSVMGIAILPVSLGAGLALSWAAFRVLRAGTKPHEA